MYTSYVFTVIVAVNIYLYIWIWIDLPGYPIEWLRYFNFHIHYIYYLEFRSSIYIFAKTCQAHIMH